MNILGCLDRPTTGTYRFMGEDVSAFGRDELARLRREAFGFVFQSYNLIGGATRHAERGSARDLRRHVRLPNGANARESLLATLGLGDRLEHRPNQLSGGQQQRVSIARALMNGGQIILADEPTGALDSKSGVEVLALLNELSRKGHTVIVITHSPEVAAHAHRVIEIRDGVVVADAVRPRRYGRRGEPVPARRTRRSESPPVLSPRKRCDPTVIHVPTAGSACAASPKRAKRPAARCGQTSFARRSRCSGSSSAWVRSSRCSPSATARSRPSSTASAAWARTCCSCVPARRTARAWAANIATMTPEDAEAIAALPNVLAAVPELGGSVTARYGNIDYQTQITSTAADFPIARNWPVARGIFFSRGDVRGYAPVAVLGQTVVRNLFPDGADPIGKHIVLKNVLFQVVGVAAERGASPMGTGPGRRRVRALHDRRPAPLRPALPAQHHRRRRRRLAHRRDAAGRVAVARSAPPHGRLPDPQHGLAHRDGDARRRTRSRSCSARSRRSLCSSAASA